MSKMFYVNNANLGVGTAKGVGDYYLEGTALVNEII